MKKLIRYAAGLPAFAAMLLVACSTAKTDVTALNGKWTVTAVNGERVTAEEKPFMEFNMPEKKLHGNTSCNIFNTEVTTDPKDASALTIQPAATTMMACPDMALEGKVLRALEAVRAVKAGTAEGQLQLVDADGKALFELEKAQ